MIYRMHDTALTKKLIAAMLSSMMPNYPGMVFVLKVSNVLEDILGGKKRHIAKKKSPHIFGKIITSYCIKRDHHCYNLKALALQRD